jgi:alpha-beta hydrolase superfamily lysophospholipase
MTRKSALGAAAIALALTTTAGAAQDTTGNYSAKSVVLVHGAFADGSSWAKVIPHLVAAGMKAVAVQILATAKGP